MYNVFFRRKFSETSTEYIMQQSIAKAKVLIDSLPYIREFTLPLILS